MGIAAIIISCIALIFSGYTLWATFLKPYKLKLKIGSPLLVMIEKEKGSGLLSLSMVLPMDFVNLSSHGGTIEDILIKLDTKSKEYPSWFLHPYYFTNEFSEKVLKESGNEIFHPIYIQGKERIYRIIIFTPLKNKNSNPPYFQLSNSELPSGEYTLTIFILDNSNQDFKQAQRISFTLVPEQVATIPGNFPFIPRTNETIEARERFFNKLRK